MWYVNIAGIDEDHLAFMGYTAVAHNDDFVIYRDYYGNDQIVDRSNPLLKVDDYNDVDFLRKKAKVQRVIAAPPRKS